MCVPTPRDSAAPASTVPTIQSASALDLGGDANRGAANLGRLQLRILGNPSVATPPPAATPPAAAQQQQASNPNSATSGTTTAGAPSVASPVGAGSPNMGLRFGATP